MNTGWTFLDWLQYVLSFSLVIALLLALLWTLRKLQNGSHMLRKKSQRLHTVETLSIGPRQKNRSPASGRTRRFGGCDGTPNDRPVCLACTGGRAD